MSYTTTTNFSLRKPIVGDSSDAWGDALNFTIDLVDTSLQSLTNSVALKADSSALGETVTLSTTGLTNYTTTANTTLATASDVTATGSYATNNFLVYTGSNWTNRTKEQAQVHLLPTYGSSGTVLRIASSGGLEWATLGFQRAYTVGTTDPAGSASSDGDLFFNTASNTLKIYNTSWVSVIQTDATTPTTGDVIALSIALGG